MAIEQTDRELIRIGKDVVTRLFVVLRTARNYAEGHSAMDIPVSKLLKSIGEIHKKKEEASIIVKGGYLYLGEIRLRPDATGFEAFNFILGELKKYGIGSTIFTEKVNAGDIGGFACIFNEVEPIPAPQTFEKFIQRMSEKNIGGIEIQELPEEEKIRAREFVEDSKEKAKRVYTQTLHAVSDVMESIKMGQTLKLRKSKRVVQNMIDQLLTAESNLLGLTTIRCHDEYTYNHSVNVCILSLAIGQRIGLSKNALCELGIAAMFHDIGKSEIPLDILNKPSKFTIDEWEIMKRHPIYGVVNLMKLKGLDALTARIVTGAFEHHLDYDLSGYPNVPYRRKMSLFGKIIAIADCYDGLTSSRVYSRVPHTPDQALKFMIERAGKSYDPVLLKLFINCVGVFPVGTLLLLTTRELAVVMENNPDPDAWKTPKVKLISDANGNEIDGEIIDLANPVDRRAIAATLNPNKYKIDISRYFI